MTALDNTQPGGEIVCLDSGGYGQATITKSVTIDCEGTIASVINPTTGAGITVNAGPSDKVIIRGVHIAGTGADAGQDGIRYIGGGELEVDKVTISGQGPNYAGINVSLTGVGVLSVRNSEFSRSAVGIKLSSTSPNIVASVTNSSFNNLSNTGIMVGPQSFVAVSNSTFSAMLGYGINATASTSTVYASDNVFSNNYFGIRAGVAGAKINATGNKMFGNAQAFNIAAGATFLSGGDNKIDINPGSTPTGALTSR